MWKYLTKEMSNEFLYSLHLLDIDIEKEYFRKLYSISNNIKDNYKVFKIKKRNGQYRKIYEPSDTLKHIQRVILENILNNKSISKYAKAYHKGISLKDNVDVHVGKKVVLKLDIKDFFLSIKFSKVYDYCFPIEYFPLSIGILLTTLVTYGDYLPQGAPTSAYISNLVMRDFDEIIGNYCEINNISYTRYSDDMTFSGDFNVGEVIDLVKVELSKLGLRINRDKIYVIKNYKRQVVTGVVVNKVAQVGCHYRNKIRQEIYYIKKYGIDSHLEKTNTCLSKSEYLRNLLGRILFVLQIRKDKEFLEYKKYILDNFGSEIYVSFNSK